MPIVTLVITNNENTRKSIETQSGGCFGFMAPTTFFTGHRARTEYVGYHLESGDQAEFCKKVFKDNNLFPYHKYMTASEFQELFGDNPNDHRSSLGNHGYVVVEMRPEGHEEQGIPQDMFISGLFTARNLTTWSNFSRVLPTLKKGVHPMMAYVINELFTYEDMAGGATLRWKRSRVSSSNIDSTAFGRKNLINMFKCLNGEKHVPYFGHEGGIFHRGGYKRDHNFTMDADGYDGIYGRIVMNMNTSSAPIQNDTPILNPYHFSPAYLGYILNETLGCEAFDMSKLLTKNNEKISKTSHLAKFYHMRDVKFRKSYRKGDVVEVRADMFGADTWVTKHGAPLGTLAVSRSLPMGKIENVGFVPVITRVEKVSKKNGIECIKLENGTWVSPRFIKTAGTHPEESVKPMENAQAPVNAFYTSRRVGTDTILAVRTYDLFDDSVRLVRVNGHLMGQEESFRLRELVKYEFK